MFSSGISGCKGRAEKRQSGVETASKSLDFAREKEYIIGVNL
jgi:hypothetical protein